MILLAFTLTVLVIIAINIFLWKSGFLRDAEEPRPMFDKPVTDARARKAVQKRLERWRQEGKISREELEHWQHLCEKEWDVETDE